MAADVPIVSSQVPELAFTSGTCDKVWLHKFTGNVAGVTQAASVCEGTDNMMQCTLVIGEAARAPRTLISDHEMG